MTTFVAELGSNHNGDLGRASALIEAAAGADCNAVKLQLFRAESLYAEGFRHKVSARSEVPFDWLPILAAEAHDAGLRFGCSVFDKVGAMEAAKHCDFLKVSSYSLLDALLLAVVGSQLVPVVVGTGMATAVNVVRVRRQLKQRAADQTWLHAVSSYPAPIDACHLDAGIGRLRQALGDAYRVGWSDHTGDGAVLLYAAFACRADMIECHLDLGDSRGDEFAGGHCWEPDVLGAMIAIVRDGGIIGGGSGQKEPQPCEHDEMRWRADPYDGLRPLLRERAELVEREQALRR